jgi:hypothetical protein
MGHLTTTYTHTQETNPTQGEIAPEKVLLTQIGKIVVVVTAHQHVVVTAHQH